MVFVSIGVCYKYGWVNSKLFEGEEQEVCYKYVSVIHGCVKLMKMVFVPVVYHPNRR